MPNKVYYLKRIVQACYILAKQKKYSKAIDREYLSLLYKKNFNRKLNWSNPTCFTEKLQILKLNACNNSLKKYSDKIKSNEYVKEILGEEHVASQIGIYQHASDITYKILKDKNCVIKCNHDSNSSFIIEKIDYVDYLMLRIILSLLLKSNYHLLARENNYKGIEPRIIIEIKENNIIKDVKFFVFFGEIKLIQIDDLKRKKRVLNKIFSETDYYNLGISSALMEEMIAATKRIYPVCTFCRIDYMVTENSYYFTEFTFYPAAGFYHYPDDLDEWLGKELILY